MPDRHRAFFLRPSLPAHRLYEALRAVIVDGEPVRSVAPRFHYTPGSLAVLCSRFRAGALPPFFQARRPGPKHQPKKAPARDRAIALRKQNHSVYDIQRVLRTEGHPLSVRAIWEILREAGFARLPRRGCSSSSPSWSPWTCRGSSGRRGSPGPGKSRRCTTCWRSSR